MNYPIKVPTDYMPELVCESQREDKIIRMRLSCHIVRVVLLDPENPNPVTLSFFSSSSCSRPHLVCELIGITLHFSLFSKDDGETEESIS